MINRFAWTPGIDKHQNSRIPMWKTIKNGLFKSNYDGFSFIRA